MPHVGHRIEEQAVTGKARAVDCPAHSTHSGIEQLAEVDEPLVTEWVELVDRNDVRRQPFEVCALGVHSPCQQVGVIGAVGAVGLGERPMFSMFKK